MSTTITTYVEDDITVGSTMTFQYPAGESAVTLLAQGAQLVVGSNDAWSVTPTLGATITFANPAGRRLREGELLRLTLRKAADVSEAVRLHYDPVTGERGMVLRVTNRTGGSSIKGMIVSPSQTADREFTAQSNEFDSVGVVAASGVPEGGQMWVWAIGAICQVLIKDGTSVARGNLLIAADDDGRGLGITNPGVGLPAAETHFKECGHVLESKDAGTNVLALCMIHFN